MGRSLPPAGAQAGVAALGANEETGRPILSETTGESVPSACGHERRLSGGGRRTVQTEGHRSGWHYVL